MRAIRKSTSLVTVDPTITGIGEPSKMSLTDPKEDKQDRFPLGVQADNNASSASYTKADPIEDG